MEYRPQSPSRRQPQSDWYFNEADVIERQMQADGHRTWGYVIYRTTYSSDDNWAEFLRRLRFHMEDTFDSYNGRDILELFTLTVFSDSSLFDGADTPTIRAHFRQWAENAFRAEQQPQDGSSGEEVRMGLSPRYQFCVQVDAAALHSVVHDAPAPPAIDLTKNGWVKLINKSWIPREEDPRARPDPNAYEPIEGVTERDVGWMKCPYQSVMTEYYSGNEGLNGWRTEYCRPPKVAGPPYDE
ncbi:hypothetical protein OEA41_008892 [Lepraria neglecta]|uniref:Uncharacterized protein n=1 Tax=Lepraria neglecta TaxID=209136 RepID=A0AAD9Z4U6_9LECA|nr:hypothetical protein OEA41_008892 [Lepraria neglecta]